MLPQFTRHTLGLHALVFPPDGIALPAMLSTVGHERRTSSDYDWHGLRRGDDAFALFQYTLRGSGRLRVGSTEWTVKTGDAILLHVPSDHRYWLPAGGEWEFIFICIYGPETLRLWSEVERRLAPCLALSPESAPVTCAARIVAGANEGCINAAPVASALAYELVALLLAERATPLVSAAPQARALAKARAFAESDLSAPIGVAELALAAGLSRFHFSRLFTEETGQTPAAWLATRRVQAAAQLLRNGELPLKDIATRCGFADVHTFGKVFRRHTGRPPARFRRNGI